MAALKQRLHLLNCRDPQCCDAYRRIRDCPNWNLGQKRVQISVIGVLLHHSTAATISRIWSSVMQPGPGQVVLALLGDAVHCFMAPDGCAIIAVASTRLA
jgi:hypothetical protein